MVAAAGVASSASSAQTSGARMGERERGSWGFCSTLTARGMSGALHSGGAAWDGSVLNDTWHGTSKACMQMREAAPPPAGSCQCRSWHDLLVDNWGVGVLCGLNGGLNEAKYLQKAPGRECRVQRPRQLREARWGARTGSLRPAACPAARPKNGLSAATHAGSEPPTPQVLTTPWGSGCVCRLPQTVLRPMSSSEGRKPA